MIFLLRLALTWLCLAWLAVPALAATRVALVIGNSAYRHVSPLDHPKNDARLIAETLRGLGFSLVGGGAQLDLDATAMRRSVQDFGAMVQGADVALVYYAGHGVAVRGSNYLVPVDANPTREADVDLQMLDANAILRQMEDAGTRLNLVILDACRNNPFGGRGLRDATGGLAQMRAPEGTLISFATQPESVAQDGTDGHSPFTKALAEVITRPGVGIFETFNDVGLEVKRATGGTQQPWVSSSPVDGEFYFAGRSSMSPAAASSVPAPAPPDPAEHTWSVIQGTTSIAILEDFVRQFGSSPYGSMARARIEELKRAQLAVASPPPPPPPAAVAPVEPAMRTAPSEHMVARAVKRNVSLGYLNLRTAPGQDEAVVVRIPAGATAMVGGCVRPNDGVSRYSFCRAEYRGMKGWASSNGFE
jgi:hypothetical protein